MQKANKELNALIRNLSIEGIPFEVVGFPVRDEATIQICFPDAEDCELDAVSHYYSYGGQSGLIEIMGHGKCQDLTNYDVRGRLTAIDAIRYFKKAWEREKDGE